MPVRVGEMSAAEPLAAALTILLGGKVAGFIHARNSLTEVFLGFGACCVHRILHGTRGGAAGKGISACGLAHADFNHAAASNIHPSGVGRLRIAKDAVCRANGSVRIFPA